jgi:hypothetical protein
MYLLMALLAYWTAPATINATPASLPAVIARSEGSQTIRLAPGNYGTLSIARRQGVRVIGPRSAVFNSVAIVRSADVAISGVTVRLAPDARTTHNTQAIRVVESSRVTLSDLLVESGPAVNGVPFDAEKLDQTRNVVGLPTGKGINIYKSSQVLVRKSELRRLHKGITFNEVRGLRIEDIDIHSLRTTPISGAHVNDVEIARIHAWNSAPWRLGGSGDHGDFIHIWTQPGQGGPSRDIRIRDNLWEQRSGAALLGIYLDDNTNRLGFEGVDIRGNVIVNSDGQGMRLERVSGAVLNNVLLWGGKGDWRKHPRIGAHAGSRQLRISGNRAAALDLKNVAQEPGIVAAGNDLRPTSAGEADRAVRNWLARFRPAPRGD